jgi:hypothetical protein
MKRNNTKWTKNIKNNKNTTIATTKKITKNKTTTQKNQKLKNMQKNLPLVFKLVSELWTSTCKWQGQGKYHTNQAKHSNNARRTIEVGLTSI